jgi:hypothetical protein
MANLIVAGKMRVFKTLPARVSIPSEAIIVELDASLKARNNATFRGLEDRAQATCDGSIVDDNAIIEDARECFSIM